MNIKSWIGLTKQDIYVKLVLSRHSDPSYVSLCICDSAGNQVEDGEILQLHDDGLIRCGGLSRKFGIPLDYEDRIKVLM